MSTITGSTRPSIIPVRFSDAERRHLDETAARLGLTRSDVIRLAVAGRLGALLEPWTAPDGVDPPLDIAS